MEILYLIIKIIVFGLLSIIIVDIILLACFILPCLFKDKTNKRDIINDK